MPNVINYGNPVPLRAPHRRNVEAFTNALNKIDEKLKRVYKLRIKLKWL